MDPRKDICEYFEDCCTTKITGRDCADFDDCQTRKFYNKYGEDYLSMGCGAPMIDPSRHYTKDINL